MESNSDKIDTSFSGFDRIDDLEKKIETDFKAYDDDKSIRESYNSSLLNLDKMFEDSKLVEVAQMKQMAATYEKS